MWGDKRIFGGQGNSNNAMVVAGTEQRPILSYFRSLRSDPATTLLLPEPQRLILAVLHNDCQTTSLPEQSFFEGASLNGMTCESAGKLTAIALAILCGIFTLNDKNRNYTAERILEGIKDDNPHFQQKVHDMFDPEKPTDVTILTGNALSLPYELAKYGKSPGRRSDTSTMPVIEQRLELVGTLTDIIEVGKRSGGRRLVVGLHGIILSRVVGYLLSSQTDESGGSLMNMKSLPACNLLAVKEKNAVILLRCSYEDGTRKDVPAYVASHG